MRELRDMLAPGDRLHLTTATQTHPGTLRLKMVEYKLEVVRVDGTRGLVFEANIEQGLTGRATCDVTVMGILAHQIL